MNRSAKKIPNTLGDFITVTEAAEIRGVSRAAIHELIQRGRLKAEKMLGRVVVSKSDVEAFEKEKPGPRTSNPEDQ